jgi:hypothetical protein
MAVERSFDPLGAAMGRTGPPLQSDQDSIKALGTTFSEPVVADLQRAGRMLGCDPDRLADAVDAAGLAPWGEAAGGVPVWRWPELCEAAAGVGIQVPRTRPTLREYHQRREAKRSRTQQQDQRRKGNDVTGRPGQAQPDG